jgi:hypothetical protein
MDCGHGASIRQRSVFVGMPVPSAKLPVRLSDDFKLLQGGDLRVRETEL